MEIGLSGDIVRILIKLIYFFPNGVLIFYSQDGIVVMGVQLLQLFKVTGVSAPAARGMDAHR